MKNYKSVLAVALGTLLAVPALMAQKQPQPKSQKEIQALQAIQAAKGNRVEAWVDAGTTVVTRDDVSQFLN